MIGIIYESGCIEYFLELIQEEDWYVPNNFMNYICKEFYPKSLLEVINSEYFDFEEDQGKGMDHIAIGCTDWSKEFEKSYNYQDNLRVVIQTAEYDFWLNNLAY